MIREIFLPNKINSYYIFAKRIIAFEITKNHIFATVLIAYRGSRQILEFFDEPWKLIDQEFSQASIKKIIESVKKYDEIRIALPSEFVIFKQVTIPFKNHKKVKLVLPFEVEPLLPFSLRAASIDAIIEEDKDQKEAESSSALVAAIKDDVMDKYINPFLLSGITPTKVTIGILELYGLYNIINDQAEKKEMVAIIDMSVDSTHVILIINGNIKSVRRLAAGVTPEFLKADLTVSESKMGAAHKKFFKDIKFSIEALIKNENLQESLSRVVVSGIGSEVSGLINFMKNLLGSPTTIFHPHKITHKRSISTKKSSQIPNKFTISLATAISSESTDRFNIGKKYSEDNEIKLFKYQVITMSVIFVSMIVSFLAYTIIARRRFKNEIKKSKKEIVNELKKEFNLRSRKKSQSLSAVLNDAKQKLSNEENIWFALSSKNKYSFMHYLQELFTRIDREELGLDLKRFSISRDDSKGSDIINMEGSVKDYDELRKLENYLEDSKLFEIVPRLEETKFNISLVVRENKDSRA